MAQAIGWRYVFYIEAGMAVPLVLFTLLARPLELRSFEKRGHEYPGKLAVSSVLPYVQPPPARKFVVAGWSHTLSLSLKQIN